MQDSQVDSQSKTITESHTDSESRIFLDSRILNVSNTSYPQHDRLTCVYENLESFRYFGFYPQYDKESRFKDLDLQSESKVYTESNPTNPKTIAQSTPNQVQDSQVDSQSKTITQSTTQNRSDAQSHTDSQPNKIHNPYSFARFYTALRHTRLYTLTLSILHGYSLELKIYKVHAIS